MSVFKIVVLVDNDSWILPYAHKLVRYTRYQGHEAVLVRNQKDIPTGDFCFLLGCTRLVSSDVLERNRQNLVVHESALPNGRGFAPMSWQILEGCSHIPICLLEASQGADEGQIWLKDFIELNGSELHDEWRGLQGEKTVELCLKFIESYRDLQPEKQFGEPSYYPRRTSEDSILDAKKSIEEQFNLLRIVDNDKYPAFFEMNGVRYSLKIKKQKD